MRWYEYKMEVDDLHASEGLKAKLLAMQAKADASGATPKPQLTPVPVPEPAKKKKAIRFPGRRVLEVAACAALCGGILYGAARVGSLPSVTLFSGGSASSTAAAYEAAPELATYSMADAGGSADRADRAVNTSGSTLLTSGNVENDTAARTADNAKIIYTTYLSIETKDYDWAYQQLNDTLSSVDGYLESSNEYTDSTDSTRTLSLTLRVPESSYDAFVDAAEQTGSVTSKSESADDVTTQYMDIEARLDNLTAQRTRLQELQASADNLTDLLQIESSLSDVQYQIESYQSQLNWYSQQVSYCTVNITLDEVETLTTGTSFAARLADAAKNGWWNFTAGAQAVVVFLMGAWPAIVIGAVCGVVFYKVRHPRKKRPNPKDAK
ncbi:Uncharacterised protein [Faecalibacterium prausnitzii]|nr:Uncharacterised protein [Faecalibacterium prausnitzii]